MSGLSQALGGPSQYALVQVEFDHALFIRRDLAPEVLPLWPEMERLHLLDHWLAGYQCNPLRRVARDDEREASFDFRSLVPHDSTATSIANAEAAMRHLLTSAKGVELPRERIASFLDSGGLNDGWRFPFSLERCEACG